MYLRVILASFIIAFAFQVLAQSFHRTISWPNANDESNFLARSYIDNQMIRPYLWFEEGVEYPDLSTMLPHYSEITPISNSIYDISQIAVTVNARKYEPLNSSETDLVKGIPHLKITQQKDEFSVYKSRGKSYLQVSVPAISYNSNNGNFEKLVGFSYDIKEIKKNNYTLTSKVTASQSVLANGDWKMIKVKKTGIYRISFAELQSMGFSNPSNISLWGHGGSQLPFWNSEPSPDDLIQIPLWMDLGSDGIFNQGDYVYFYAQGPVTWSYNPDDDFFTHNIHDYAEHIHYFLTISVPNPLRISNLDQINTPHTRSSTAYDALVFFERNDTNLIKSGRQWFGEAFDVYTTRTYSTGLKDPVSNGKAKVRIRAIARSSVSSSYSLKANGNSIGAFSVSSVNVASQYTNFAAATTQTFEFPYVQNELQLELTYNKPSPAAKGWLDFITINARQRLAMNSEQFQFRDRESVGSSAITEFSIANSPAGMMIWDVTDFFNPANLKYSQGATSRFKAETSSLKEYIAFLPSQAMPVNLVEDIQNQNIHGQPQPEMVIVSHPNFLTQAQELAQIHLENSGLRTLVLTNQQVYNEFSSGNPDVGAIRNMMRMFYNRSTSEADMPKYLLLFGDGSYDNRTISASNTNYILTYQSENSLHVTNSFVSDDFFGLLDYNEGEATGLLDIGIGRIPSSTLSEAVVAVSKIKQYLNPSSFGSWNNQLCFIGDDGDGNLHMRDSDLLAKYVEEEHPNYNIDKIYFDAYPLVSTSMGDKYPAVTEAINNRANQGVLIMNYIGHANARWLAHERVLMIDDILGWRNFDKLSLFVTATCEFSRFDDFGYKSAGEHTLFSPRGGSVGLVSTSRVVYSNPNYTLNRNFIRYAFAQRPEYSQAGEKHYRLGDVLRLAKVSTGGQINKRNFMLLGDPALKLHYPELSISVTEINGTAIGNVMDTLKALSKVELRGTVSGAKFANDFRGEAEITLFDKATNITTLSNTGGLPFSFQSRQSSIYKGRSTISDGNYSATFIIPKDITYNYGSGRFSLFANNGVVTGVGHFEDFVVGGISDNVGNDVVGPEISLFLNSTNFVTGGITDENPKLLVHLVDSSGINTTGVGIGHDLTATLTGETETTHILNDYYVAEVDSYQKGKVEYQLSGLKPGNYSVRVKAWDVFNNSSEAEIDFTVKSDLDFKLSHILNYPNPFTQYTGFYFEHNQPYEDFDVSIQIFSPSGRLVKTIEQFFPNSPSYRIGPINWDGLDDFGDRIGRGVYFYRLRVRLGSGKTAEAYQKLVILK